MGDKCLCALFPRFYFLLEKRVHYVTLVVPLSIVLLQSLWAFPALCSS